MQWDKNFETMAHKVLSSLGCYPTREWLGFAYICFDSDMGGYNADKCDSPVIYYAHRLRARVQQERRYSGLVHVPVLKQEDEVNSYLSFDQPLSEGGSNLLEILEVETDDDYSELFDRVMDIAHPLVVRHYKDGVSMADLAKENGVSRQYIHTRIQGYIKKLKKSLTK